MPTILTIRHLAGSLAGQTLRVAIEEGRVLRLGRLPASDVKFTDTVDDSVSGVHAELSWRGGKLYVEDQRSTNGTYVDGVPCPPFQLVLVPERSILSLAKAGPRMEVSSDQGTGPTAPWPPAPTPEAKETVGKTTLMRAIELARHEERDVLAQEIAKARRAGGLWALGLLLLVLAVLAVSLSLWWMGR